MEDYCENRSTVLYLKNNVGGFQYKDCAIVLSLVPNTVLFVLKLFSQFMKLLVLLLTKLFTKWLFNRRVAFTEHLSQNVLERNFTTCSLVTIPERQNVT